jgi:putative transposase
MSIPRGHADASHIVAVERVFFVTSSIAEKRNLLQSDRSARLFIAVLYHYRAQQKYLLHGFVVMPDHFHLLISVDSGTSIERAVQFVKGGFAFRAGKELGFRPPVWQRGFSEVRIYDLEHFAHARQYILNNPVRRRLLERPSDYPYCSARNEFVLDGTPRGLKPARLRMPTQRQA